MLAQGTDYVAVPIPDEPETVALLPLEGWARGHSYRVTLTTDLADTAGRPLTQPRDLALVIPAEGAVTAAAPPDLAVNYDSVAAASSHLGGRFPGGQTMLFQGLWTDPATGIAYARNRWYGPHNAAWLSQDPLGPVDSPNLYAFVGWGPHSGTDPMGLRGLCDWTGNATCRDVWSGILDEGRDDASRGFAAVESIPPKVGAWAREKWEGALRGDSPVDPNIAELQEAAEIPSDVSIDQNVQPSRTFNRRFANETADVVEKLSSEGTEQGMYWGVGKTLEYGFGLLLTKSKSLLRLERRMDDVAPMRRVDNLVPGSSAHKAQRWADYEARGGSWSYDRWSNQYEVNMRNPQVGLGRERVYREALGGESRMLQTPYGNRQIDVFVPDSNLLLQVKTGGKQYLTTQGRLANTLAIKRDAWLVKQGYSVEWVLEGGGSKQLLQALDDASIKYHLGPILK